MEEYFVNGAVAAVTVAAVTVDNEVEVAFEADEFTMFTGGFAGRHWYFDPDDFLYRFMLRIVY